MVRVQEWPSERTWLMGLQSHWLAKSWKIMALFRGQSVIIKKDLYKWQPEGADAPFVKSFVIFAFIIISIFKLYTRYACIYMNYIQKKIDPSGCLDSVNSQSDRSPAGSNQADISHLGVTRGRSVESKPPTDRPVLSCTLIIVSAVFMAVVK